MRTWIIVLLSTILIAINSCGILGIYPDKVNRDPAYQAKMFAEINNSPLGLKMDSLLAKIDSAKSMLPSDLSETTLIVETFSNYSDYLKRGENKFNSPKDTKKERKYFKKYLKNKDSQIKDPKYNVVYLDKTEYNTKDIKEFKYVLKTTIRLHCDPNHLTIDNTGFIYPYVSTLVHFILNRETNEVFSEIKDITILTKKN